MVRVTALLLALAFAAHAAGFDEARENGKRFEQSLAAMERLMQAWLRHADPRTLLLPDRIGPNDPRLYTPHNSGADLYPYLILTAHLTHRDIYQGRMMDMLRNEIRYTNAEASIPGNYDLTKGELGPPSMFGAGEYAKDGLLSVTEYLGRTPWFYRMVDMIADAMNHAPIETKYGRLPASDAELNGDYLQALMRLATMTGDPRFLTWARRIGDAYIEEVLPGNHGVPSSKWDFATHKGDGMLRLRDHGNETVVGMVLLYALENFQGTERAKRYRPVIQNMLDRILSSTNEDGMLYNQLDAATLKPVNTGLSDNWGYVYGAVYTFYQCTGEAKYRDAVRKVLSNLGKYRNWAWEPRKDSKLGSFDGYADSIESALYLVNREPVPEALAWIDSEMQVMLKMQRPDGLVEDWYGEGNFNRTAMLYALMKSQGVRPEEWKPGIRVGAVRDEKRLLLSLQSPQPVKLQFDYARHRRVLNLDRNYVRLNEFPEWYTVDENTLYRVRATTSEQTYLGSQLIAGITMTPGEWTIEPISGK
ncbi:MAG: hypothetical protein JST93_14075 [Acidobacteria bacterium]|nr:hypothetical protein [Acidobacteriota bacterium]